MSSELIEEHRSKNQVLDWWESLKDIDKGYRYEVSFNSERPWHNAIYCEYDVTTEQYVVSLRQYLEAKSPLVVRDFVRSLGAVTIKEFNISYDFYDAPSKTDKLTKLIMQIQNPVKGFTLHKNTLDQEKSISVSYNEGKFTVESMSFIYYRLVSEALSDMRFKLYQYLTEDNAVEVYKVPTLEDLAGEPI